MKDKNVAGILALFFGALGIHRFYLGQIGLGILYLFFFWFTWFLGLIDAIAFFAMDKDDFDFRYNRLAIQDSSSTPAEKNTIIAGAHVLPSGKRAVPMQRRRPLFRVNASHRPQPANPIRLRIAAWKNSRTSTMTGP